MGNGFHCTYTVLYFQGLCVVTFLSVSCNEVIGPEFTFMDERIAFIIKKPLKVQRKEVMSVLTTYSHDFCGVGA